MALIKSISGIRGTIGGEAHKNLTPLDLVMFASAFGTWLQRRHQQKNIRIVIGRDARPSGEILSAIVSATLQGLGIHVVDLSLSTTPTVEIMVPELKAQGGIILTASHNPNEWNALKLLNEKGEFINAKNGAEVLDIATKGNYEYASVDDLGKYERNENGFSTHIAQILNLPLVDAESIRQKKFRVVLDAVNSTGALAVPLLLEKLGVEVIPIHCECNGQFAHNPEPLKEHLGDIMQKVKETKADMGIVVDPDVDRLAIIDENGDMFGEEYSLVAIADFVLKHTAGSAVSNLSSSRALRDICVRHGQSYAASAVGEVNVVELMKENKAIIGGEGNGGIIYPALHYGRDSLVGIALFLTSLSESGVSVSELRKTFPDYFMAKMKIELDENTDVDEILENVKVHFSSEEISTIDGVKIDFANKWLHLRKSNTEPIIRIYTEAPSQTEADELAKETIVLLEQLR